MSDDLDFKAEANAMVGDLSEYWQDRILKRVQSRLASNERFLVVSRYGSGDSARQMLLTEIRRAIEYFGLTGGHDG